MKQGIVKFSKEFVTETGLKEWVGVELSFDQDAEIAMDVLRRSETIVNEYQRPKSYIIHYGNSAPVQYGPFETVPQKSDSAEIGLTPELLMSCTDIVSLHSFYMLVERSKDVTLKIAYDNRKAQLVAKETKEILSATEKNARETNDQRSNN